MSSMQKLISETDIIDAVAVLSASKRKVAMADIFAFAKHYQALNNQSIKKLLNEPDHLSRLIAVSIMDFIAREKNESALRKRQVYELYVSNLHQIDTWDLVDRAAPYVVGGYLNDKPRDILYELARSDAPMARRTAIVATYYFIRQNDLFDTFTLAEILVHDPEELVQKAVGGWIREAGKRDPLMLEKFLDKYATTMPRTMLRYASKHFPSDERSHYLKLKGEKQ